MNPITAHGKTYQTIAEAEAAWSALEAENNRPGVGPSDGRVTEQIAIEDAIDAARYAEALANTRARNAREQAAAPAAGSLTETFLAEADNRIAYLTRNKAADDGKWRYLMYRDQAGRVTRREYRTELGFNKAYARAARAGMDIQIAE